MNEKFEKEVIDRLARIETTLKDLPCKDNTKRLNWLETKTNIGIGGVGVMAYIINLIKS